MNLYIVSDKILASIAEAIREKSGKNLKLTFPQDYIKEINQLITTTTDYNFFEEEYIITPTMNEQIFNTKNKIMSDNIVVQQIPYYDVANQYGRTIIIGGD